MISNSFVEELSKNRVLIDDNDCLDVRCFEMLSDRISLPFRLSLKKYGAIYLTISGVKENVKVIYYGVELIVIGEDGEYFLPITFVKNSEIYLEGKCDKVVIKLYGSKFNCDNLRFLLPLNKVLVCGDKTKSLCEFESYQDLLNGNYTEINKFDNCYFVQTYCFNGAKGIGKLFSDNGLKFSSSKDGFNSSILISGGNVQKAIFLQDASSSIMYFVYLENNKLFYRRYSEDSAVLGEENGLDISNEGGIDLVASAVSTMASKFFALRINGGFAVYVIKGDGLIEKVYEGLADNLDLYESDDNLVVCFYKDNCATRLEFSYNINNIGFNVLEIKNSKIIQNVVNVLEYNNMNIYTTISGYKGLCD